MKRPGFKEIELQEADRYITLLEKQRRAIKRQIKFQKSGKPIRWRIKRKIRVESQSIKTNWLVFVKMRRHKKLMKRRSKNSQ